MIEVVERTEIRQNGKADFHVHYDPLQPEQAKQLILEARSKGIDVIALVGRGDIPDSLSLDNLIQFGQENKVTVLPAVEYPVTLDGGITVDLIALDFNYRNPEIRDLFGLAEWKIKHAKIAQNQLNFLQGEGVNFEIEEPADNALLQRLLDGEEGTEKAIKFCRIVAGNPKNSALIQQLTSKNRTDYESVLSTWGQRPNYKDNSQAILAKFLWYIWFRTGQPGHRAQGEGVQTIQWDSPNIVTSIHNAGGIVLYSVESEFNNEVWSQLDKIGIDGVMGGHGGSLLATTREQGRGTMPIKLIQKIRRAGKLVLMGSDYDPKKADWPIGQTLVSSRRYYVDIQNYKKAKGIPSNL